MRAGFSFATLLMNICAILLSASAQAGEPGTRYTPAAKRLAKGPHINPLSGTFYGTKSHEELNSVGVQPDGTVVVFGNSYGPDFPAAPVPTVLGKGEWFNVSEARENSNAAKEEGGEESVGPLDPNYPNRAGFILRYSGDLSKIESVTRMDWGVAWFRSGVVGPDGAIYVNGVATNHFADFAKNAPVFKEIPKPDNPKYGPVNYQGIALPGDVFVARLSAEATKVEWVYLFKGHRSCTQLWPDHKGGVFFESGGLKRISADGQNLEQFNRSGGGARVYTLQAVSPKDGTFVYAGESHHGTGREPWRKPVLSLYDPQGQQKWEAYNWPGPMVGHDAFRQVSDSAVRACDFDSQNNIVFYGWSDGGNSVFTNSPLDLSKGVKNTSVFEGWGAGVASFAHLVRLEPKDLNVLHYGFLCSYSWTLSKPNSLRIDFLKCLSDDSLFFSGGAAAHLVQTPNPWTKDESVEWPEGVTPGAGGAFVAVVSKDLGHYYFARATPDCSMAAAVETPAGIVAVGRASRNKEKTCKAPTFRGLQLDFGGGQTDGYLLLLEKPAAVKTDAGK